MPDRAFLPSVLLAIGALAAPAERVYAQAPGYAEILTPSAGASLEGLVSIEGTADHPAFLRYELAFAYDPNPTNTWYPLGEPVPTRGQQSTLGLWDVSNLSPGIYQLRLRVHLESGAALEDTARGLRIGLPAPAAEPTAQRTAPPAAASATAPAVAPAATAIPPATRPSADPVGLALAIGGLTATALLSILALYIPLRRRLADWAGTMRMRRVLRQDQRRRRSRGGG